MKAYLAGILWIGMLWGFFLPAAFAQSPASVNVQLEFLEDTCSIGQPIPLRLEVVHPADMMIFTPRSKKDFFPFELIEMVPEPTRTREGVSTDVVTYYLSTFQLGTYQSVPLTVSYRRPDDKDLQRIDVRSDSIRLIERIPAASPLLAYRSHEDLPTLNDPPNYVLIFLLLVITGALVVMAALWFRGPIERYLRIRRVKNEWNKVAGKIQQLSSLQTDQANLLDQLNRIWKGYLDPKSAHSLLSMTTTELSPAMENLVEINPSERDRLLQLARTGDEVIYAGTELNSAQIQSLAQTTYDLLYEVFLRRIVQVSKRTDYTRQFIRKFRRFLQPRISGTRWKGY